MSAITIRDTFIAAVVGPSAVVVTIVAAVGVSYTLLSRNARGISKTVSQYVDSVLPTPRGELSTQLAAGANQLRRASTMGASVFGNFVQSTDAAENVFSALSRGDIAGAIRVVEGPTASISAYNDVYSA